MGCLWVTQVYAQWGGSESLQRREAGILGGYYYTAYIPLLSYPAAMVYGEKVAQTDITVLKLLLNGNFARQNFLLGLEQIHTSYVQQSDFSLGFGKNISKQASIGIRIGYNEIHARGYGSQGRLNSGLGMFLKVSESMSWAMQINHLESLKQQSDWNNFSGKTGMGWVVSNVCGLSVALEILENRNTNLEFGLYYQFLDRARMRMEFDTNIPALRISFGYVLPLMDVEIFTAYQVSGNTSFGLALNHRFKKKSA